MNNIYNYIKPWVMLIFGMHLFILSAGLAIGLFVYIAYLIITSVFNTILLISIAIIYLFVTVFDDNEKIRIRQREKLLNRKEPWM